MSVVTSNRGWVVIARAISTHLRMAAKHRSDPHSDFGFIALSPAGPADAAVAIAGSRAGALGVLNL
jgi:hypothetical protein